MNQPYLQFPPGFLWGTATSAYQIEGAVTEDNRGASIWDIFTQKPGRIYHNQTGDVSADHYHLWQEDIAIMAQLGLKAYRFSIAWPRIFPKGKGVANQAGLDFYDRLVDGLLEQGIRPFPTLYHWDLPQELQEQGGWENRQTAYYFADYAHYIVNRLADRVTDWITLNEPLVVVIAGYYTGEHAPGKQDLTAAFRVAHHLLLSHGLAVQSMRQAANRQLNIGIALNLSPIHTATSSAEDQRAARLFDGVANRLCLDAIFKGHYPEDVLSALGPIFGDFPSQDLTTISTPIEFLGVNYYSRNVVRFNSDIPIIQAELIQPIGNEYSMMWEIYPPGIYELLTRLWNDYHPKALIITENGICVPDGIDFDGRVRDERRIRYLRDHIVQVHRAIQENIPVLGYFVWTLMDNFEWAHGYRMRFGLVYVDFETLKRKIKDSGRWYSRLILKNGVGEG